MDDFSWGNTRVVVGEGKDKIIQMPEDEYFDDSMIPLKKFSGASRPPRHSAFVTDSSDCPFLPRRPCRLRERNLGEGLAAGLGLDRRQRLRLAARERPTAGTCGCEQRLQLAERRRLLVRRPICQSWNTIRTPELTVPSSTRLMQP
jgi:hypothetical protein